MLSAANLFLVTVSHGNDRRYSRTFKRISRRVEKGPNPDADRAASAISAGRKDVA